MTGDIIATTTGDIIEKIGDMSADMLNLVAALARLWPPLRDISTIRA